MLLIVQMKDLAIQNSSACLLLFPFIKDFAPPSFRQLLTVLGIPWRVDNKAPLVASVFTWPLLSVCSFTSPTCPLVTGPGPTPD